MVASKSPRRVAMEALRRLSSVKATIDTEIGELFPFGVWSSRPRNPADDRALVLISATVVEQGLEHAILAFFSAKDDEQGRDARDILFDGDAAVIGEFGAKIKIARVAKIIGGAASADLQLIRVIRNSFAHSRHVLNFETSEVAAVCSQLQCPLDWEGLIVGHEENTARGKCVQTCFQLCTHLYTYPQEDDELPSSLNTFVNIRHEYMMR